LPTEMVGLARF